jgi:hypothetical protein
MKRILALLIFVSAAFSLASAQRLPEVATPENYKVTFKPDLAKATFEGDETISVRVLKPTSEITLNAAEIEFHDVTITSGGTTQKAKVTPERDKEMVVLAVEKPLAAEAATVHITYSGILNDQMRGFYLGKDDQGRKYAATQFESSISPRSPTRVRLQSRIKRLSRIRPAPATNTRSALPPRRKCRPIWRPWS